jgi:hypothetical protein
MKFEHGGGDGFSHKLIWNNGKDYVYVGVCSSKRAHREFPKAFAAAMNANVTKVEILTKALHTLRDAAVIDGHNYSLSVIDAALKEVEA